MRLPDFRFPGRQILVAIAGFAMAFGGLAYRVLTPGFDLRN
jgi:hypothetical protein